jgi:hypothetical protein
VLWLRREGNLQCERDTLLLKRPLDSSHDVNIFRFSVKRMENIERAFCCAVFSARSRWEPLKQNNGGLAADDGTKETDRDQDKRKEATQSKQKSSATIESFRASPSGAFSLGYSSVIFY